jgi:hypothetical protein
MRTCFVEAGQLWQHFKGTVYEIVCVATREADQEPMVVYREASTKSLGPGTIWVRPLLEFVGEVHEKRRTENGGASVFFKERFTPMAQTSIHTGLKEESCNPPNATKT